MNPGTIVDDKYRIERKLGEGGMATVFAATHIHLNEPVALKVLLPTLAGNPVVVERFMREARAAVRLKSEHVVRVFDVGTLPTQQPYIAMEFLDGDDLEATLQKRGKLPSTEAVDYVMQVCEALAEAHAAGIVHRDLKPANFVLAMRNDGMPSIKVLDFGIAKLMLADAGPALTATQATMGTPAFMSPEQIRGAKDVDHRGDIWSIGVTLFELITGGIPFRADTYGKLVMLVMREPTPPMNGLAPPGLEAVIGKCLAKDREHRYQQVGELAVALEPFAGNRHEAATLAQRAVGLARAAQARAATPGQPRAATPAPGVPVQAPSHSQTPSHGNQPMMQTPAHGNPPHGQQHMQTPAHGQQPMMHTPAQGSPPHGQHPHMQTPAYGQQPMMHTPAHGNPPHGQHPHMQTPAHGQQPMMQTPAHGNPPRGQSTHGNAAHGQQPMMQTPAHGNPHGQSTHGNSPHGQQPMMQTPAYGQQPMMQTPAHGNPPHGQPPHMQTPAHGQQPMMQTPVHGQQPMMQTPAHGSPPHGQHPHMQTSAHGQQPMMQTPAHGQPPADNAIAPAGQATPTATGGSGRRVLVMVIVGVIVGSIAGLAILLSN